MSKIYDVIVLGGGLAGYYSARALKKGGKSVALIEKESLGGTAIRWGALPVKKVLDAFKNNNNIEKDYKNIRENLMSTWEEELEELNSKIEKNLIKIGVDLYYGDGEFLDSKRYKINDKTLQTKYFIISTGTEPASVDNFKIDKKHIISHKEVIDLKNIPEKVTVLGGNVEGIELAALYAEMGIEVTIVEKEKFLLFENDRDLVEPIENHLISRGVKVIKGVGAKKVDIEEDGIKVILENGSIVTSNKAVTTFMRKPNFPKGIEKTEIKTDENKILVNENLLTNEANIFAIGDINGILGMGHVAIQQGLAVANHILNNCKININYEILPRAVFTLPEMAGVGKQEWELKEANISYKVGKCYFEDTWRGWSKKEKGFVKIILDKNNIILGIWMIGENVSEYIGLLGLAIKKEKSADDILSNLIIHPSLGEAILEATIEGKEKVIK